MTIVLSLVMKTNLSKLIAGLTMATAIAVPTLLPADAQAQRGRYDDRRHDYRRSDYRRNDRYDHRQSTKNQWRNLGIAGGAVGVAGLLTGNRTLTALGLGGGLYSAYRYEQDRRSQNRLDRNRYELFRRRSFDYGGHRYERRERFRDGQRHYYFSRIR
jgi:hypothetical protein